MLQHHLKSRPHVGKDGIPFQRCIASYVLQALHCVHLNLALGLGVQHLTKNSSLLKLSLQNISAEDLSEQAHMLIWCYTGHDKINTSFVLPDGFLCIS